MIFFILNHPHPLIPFFYSVFQFFELFFSSIHLYCGILVYIFYFFKVPAPFSFLYFAMFLFPFSIILDVSFQRHFVLLCASLSFHFRVTIFIAPHLSPDFYQEFISLPFHWSSFTAVMVFQSCLAFNFVSRLSRLFHAPLAFISTRNVLLFLRVLHVDANVHIR